MRGSPRGGGHRNVLARIGGNDHGQGNITFCEVQAVDCIESDLQSCQLIFNSALGVGEAIISQTGSLCYRRDEKPGDCSSALQANWNCITNFADAPKRYEVR